MYVCTYIWIWNISELFGLAREQRAATYVFGVTFQRVLFHGKYGLDIRITTCDLFQKCFGCWRASFARSQWKWHVSACESINLDSLRGSAQAPNYFHRNTSPCFLGYLKSVNMSLPQFIEIFFYSRHSSYFFILLRVFCATTLYELYTKR